MATRLKIKYGGKCPCGENGKNGTLRHTRQVAWAVRDDYKIAICGNHIGNYRDAGQGDSLRMLRKKRAKG